jgi:hypothetical protein
MTKEELARVYRDNIENNNIILEFPGSQGLTAAELVKASAMYFHVVNEKFSSPYSF